MEKIVKKLLQGDVVAIPTDTVYGLAATFESVEALFALKGRGRDQPILVLAASLAQIEPYLDNPPASFFSLAQTYWPGALTLVVPVKGDLPGSVQKEGRCGFRIPNHPIALEILAAAGPLAVTSANTSGHPPPKSAEEVSLDVEVVDGGPVSGEPSTIAVWDSAHWQVVRQGPLRPDFTA